MLVCLSLPHANEEEMVMKEEGALLVSSELLPVHQRLCNETDETRDCGKMSIPTRNKNRIPQLFSGLG